MPALWLLQLRVLWLALCERSSVGGCRMPQPPPDDAALLYRLHDCTAMNARDSGSMKPPSMVNQCTPLIRQQGGAGALTCARARRHAVCWRDRHPAQPQERQEFLQAGHMH